MELTELDPFHVIDLRTKIQTAKDMDDGECCPESKWTVNLNKGKQSTQLVNGKVVFTYFLTTKLWLNCNKDSHMLVPVTFCLNDGSSLITTKNIPMNWRGKNEWKKKARKGFNTTRCRNHNLPDYKENSVIYRFQVKFLIHVRGYFVCRLTRKLQDVAYNKSLTTPIIAMKMIQANPA